jgi:hypothetical protein
MAKGLCCQLQADGLLGREVQLTIHKKDGTTVDRCGVCEVGPSCSNPQKDVFRFRFIPSAVCNIPGTSACTPTPAGIAQYQAARTAARTTGSPIEVQDVGALSGIGARPPARYSTLPVPGSGGARRVTYTLP